MNGEFFMSDRLPRSNSQSHLPNYGPGQSDDKSKDVGNKKDGAPAKSDKNAGQGHSDKNKAAPQMKSREEKKVKALEAWFKERIPNYYIYIDEAYGTCTELKDWLKVANAIVKEKTY